MNNVELRHFDPEQVFRAVDRRLTDWERERRIGGQPPTLDLQWATLGLYATAEAELYGWRDRDVYRP